MKQTVLMAVITLIGMIGSFTVEPFVGVAVYYLFAVLRPQNLWEWALPPDVAWSAYVSWATLAATAWWLLNSQSTGADTSKPLRVRFTVAHKAFLAFGAWACVAYVTAQNHDAAWPWFLEYMKIFVMFGVASLVITNIRQVWWIYRLITLALMYIAYEVNFLYLVGGRLDIYNLGYGGLDNNGAGLMLAMGVPLAIHAWEGTIRWWRWGFLAAIPLLLHAVLMSYSRGAMVSLIAVTPLLLLRSGRKKQFALIIVLLGAMVPYLAGQQIRERFFSIDNYESDVSAKARFGSWTAAILIANDYPLFGVGIRNSPLFSHQYGADFEGRAIHSQYLQTLADTGYPGLTLYLFALGSVWLSMSRTRQRLKAAGHPDAHLARNMISGVEGALLVFCVGAVFLSLEVVELPYIASLMAVQISALVRVRSPRAPVAHAPPVLPTMLLSARR